MQSEKRVDDRCRAVFIDRDGVVVRIVMRDGVPTSPFRREEFAMDPYAEDALKKIGAMGFKRFLASNQPDVAYDHLTYAEWKWMHRHVEKLSFDDMFVCMHGREDECECKKPKPGLLLDAAEKWNVDLSRSFMIGDTEADTKAARAAGVKSILIDAPYNQGVKSDYRVKSFMGAANLISALERGDMI